MLLLDEEEITGDDELENALFGDHSDTDVAEDSDSMLAEAVESMDSEDESVPLKEADLVATDLLDSFLDGLGINRSELHPDTDLAEVMQNAGEVLREFVEGTTQLLASRANLKNAFRLDQTTVLPRHNNPIKLSANTKDSIKQLLVGREGEYLGPRDAVREVCRDLLFHQDAFLDAMNSAFIEFADRFDPDELQEGFDRTLGSNLFTKFLRKSKYWAMYGDLYPILTEKGGARFPQMYAEEFVSAYERQIAEYKRLGGADAHFKETVVLNKEELAPAKTGPDAESGTQESPDVTGEVAIDLDDEDIAELETTLNSDDVANEDLPAGDFTDDEPDQAKG